MSQIFDHPNLSFDWKCPICRTGEDKAVILVSIPGTQEGNNIEAQQVHFDCAQHVHITYCEAVT